jgi:hypothetical protein
MKPDIITVAEKKRLVSLGKKLEELEEARLKLLKEARTIIGFENPEPQLSFEEEMDGIVKSFATPWDETFVVYAHYWRSLWNLEESMQTMKSAMKELGLSPSDLDWDNLTAL